MKITIDTLEQYLLNRYGGWANEQGLFLKLVEEMGEVAEVINMRAGSKAAPDVDLQKELGTELADMIHYIVIVSGLPASRVNSSNEEVSIYSSILHISLSSCSALRVVGVPPPI